VECDAQLPVAEARRGDPAAWDALFKRYQLPLYAYVFELVRHEQTCLDIVQETFINATRYLGSLRNDQRFGSWLFAIAHQKCIQQWRKPKRDEVPWEDPLDELVGAEAGPADMMIRQEQEAELMARVAELPLAQRSVLLLHFIEGFSLEEIAHVTQAHVGTVKSRLHYAKRALRELLKP